MSSLHNTLLPSVDQMQCSRHFSAVLWPALCQKFLFRSLRGRVTQVTAAHDLMVLSVERKQDAEAPAGVAILGTSEPSAEPGETAGPITATQVLVEDHVAASPGPGPPHSTGQNRAAQNGAGGRQRADAGALKQQRAQAKAAASAARQERMDAEFEWDPVPQAEDTKV